VIRADGQDLCYFTVKLVDPNGLLNPKAENLISFTVNGPGSIIAVGNANPVSVESFQLPQRRAWHGRCLVIVKSGNTKGTITLKATAPELNPASFEILVN
jgi:beta-galactosidase